MVGLSFCDFVGTREEKVKMAEYRKKEWPRRYKVAIILFIKPKGTLNLLLEHFDNIVFVEKCRMVPICGN